MAATSADPAAARGTPAADVYKVGRLAGQLRREGDDVVFAYSRDYLDDPDAPAVAFSLPRLAGPARATAGAVPPFFAGLLPEGTRLLALTTAARTSTDDHLTLLLLVGADSVGDVQVVAAGQHPADPPPLFDPRRAAEVDLGAVFARATSTTLDELDRVALPGVQVKVSSRMVSAPLRTTAGPAILKLNPPEYQRLVENEHFFLGLAGDCGVPVPAHEVVHDRAGAAGLLVERFDRVVAGEHVLRLAQEDACQVLGRYPAAKYRLTLQEAIAGLAEAVAAAGGSRPLAVLRLLQIAVVSYLIGNGDLHGKNLSIRRAPSGVWEAAPAYDLLSTQPYLGWRDPMALPLYGRANRLHRRWWVEAAGRLGLRERAAARMLDEIVGGCEPWLHRVGEIGLDDVSSERLHALLVRRRAELAG